MHKFYKKNLLQLQTREVNDKEVFAHKCFTCNKEKRMKVNCLTSITIVRKCSVQWSPNILQLLSPGVE